MKLEKLVEFAEGLKALAQIKFNDAQLAWDLAEAIEKAEAHIKRFESKREEYIRANGKADKDNPDQFTITDIAAYKGEMKKLAEVDVKAQFPSFTIADLNGAVVSPSDMRAWKQLNILK